MNSEPTSKPKAQEPYSELQKLEKWAIEHEIRYGWIPKEKGISESEYYAIRSELIALTPYFSPFPPDRDTLYYRGIRLIILGGPRRLPNNLL